MFEVDICLGDGEADHKSRGGVTGQLENEARSTRVRSASIVSRSLRQSTPFINARRKYRHFYVAAKPHTQSQSQSHTYIFGTG